MSEEFAPKPVIGGLGRKLIQAKLLSQEQALEATEAAFKQERAFISYVVANGLVDSTAISQIASQEFGIPLFDLSSFDNTFLPRDLIKVQTINKFHALPLFQRGNKLYVAISDPTNQQALEEVKFQTRLVTEAILVEEHKLSSVIGNYVSKAELASLGSLEDASYDSIDIESDESDKTGTGTKTDDDAPVVKYINKVLLEGIQQGASDIHFEPYEKTYRIRFRQDGMLFEYASPPANLAPRISSRLKVLSQLDISERRVPQDGRFKMRLSNNRAIDFRVSTCPTLFGEKVVMRILDPSSAQMGIDALGYEEFQKKFFLEAIAKPQGLVLVTGPTGSGKTVSLYTALNILNTIENNISTCEDPVEINLPGINQVNINNKAGLNFSTALRAFLRQDPDIIMVGEIRDLETAEIAVKAAQTGHLVLSTLHTNSAADTLSRLISMGIPSYNLATSVTLIIAQRLARKLCAACKTPITLPAAALKEIGFLEEEFAELKLYAPHGCASCKGGYKGRVGLYEVMPITESIAQLIMQGGNAIDISNQAIKDGIWLLRKSALHKLKTGLISIEEVSRVTKE